jgi:hypothetical protein
MSHPACHHFSTPPLTNIRFKDRDLASLHFQEWQGIPSLDGRMSFVKTIIIHPVKFVLLSFLFHPVLWHAEEDLTDISAGGFLVV